MGLKTIEIEGVWSIGIMGSMDKISNFLKALEACELVDVKFLHDPEGDSGYYAVPFKRPKSITIKELPAVTLEEFTALEKEISNKKEKEAAEKEQPVDESITEEQEDIVQEACGCNGNTTCSVCCP